MSILEGPSLDLEGNLYVVNGSYGQEFRISPKGDVALVAEYDGEPNGLMTTNVAYGGPERRTLCITEADTRLVLMAKVPVSGLGMYSMASQ